jgi:hypothetical protein
MELASDWVHDNPTGATFHFQVRQDTITTVVAILSSGEGMVPSLPIIDVWQDSV